MAFGADENNSSFSDDQNNALQITVIAASCISILGSAFICLSYASFPSLRSFPNKLIVYLSIADLFSSVSYLIKGSNNLACQTQAAMEQYFTVATFFWTAVFAFNVAQVLVYQKTAVERYEPYYHLFCWGVPGALLGVDFARHAFGSAVVWCWITAGQDLLRLLTFYLPLILVFLFNILVYFLVGKALSGNYNQGPVQRRLRQYILVFLFIRVWSVANRLQNFIEPDNPIFALYLMHGLFSPLQGFFNALVYGVNLQVRQHYAAMCCPSCVNSVDLDETSPIRPRDDTQDNGPDNDRDSASPTHYHAVV